MCVKKWIGCAILFYICYLIVNYLDKPVESFGRRGIGLRRGGYYGGGYYGGRGIRYPVVVTQDYYPSYWYRYIPFFGY
jgi:hypothetical protein